MEFETLCIHGSKDNTHNTGAVCVPIYQSATFTHPSVGESTGYDYSRQQNPTREQLEQTVASLEGGAGALAFSSGMAAVACMLELFSPGDEIVASEDLYGGTVRLFESIAAKNGIRIFYADTGKPDELQSVISYKTKAVFIETPTNPMMNVTDIAKVKRSLCGRKLLLIVDNTFLTPYFCKPLKLGADIVIHSGSKYLGGHNDTIAGFLSAKESALCEKLRFIQKTTGAALAPFDSFLLLRGIKTLALRMNQAQRSAGEIAQWLKKQEKIKAVHYVGLPEHPGYEISKKQASGFGAMISFEVDTKETAVSVLERVKLILYAESLGGVESLITYPILQTHADVPEEKRVKLGINERLLRLSVGAENVKDLINDLNQAIN
ncbi:MAG: PLP-dependent aspartate aminotransferase family protein [Oscillospiraceae bacterium]|nr:PLP-dependent aspartate aminotransferase family protein [Oscillospiraceae bacterium]